ncbi:MAG: 4-hydroxythreonine-4-phosphate dehydrogenase PdxA [Gammaproteobacteria bacterium]|nr:4-hydroxythreonine-4-phosphate dehydrogenase PdxA [Gammaproteobacteria bacterium]TVQ49344.1 MAG: 4-hydroxythreonine-4-phosphate dehydrogenase PdxA [Gammaproteobacteria bacterium]
MSSIESDARAQQLPRLVLTSGEPAGIGPELCLMLAAGPLAARLVVCADPTLLTARARALALDIDLDVLTPDAPIPQHRPGRLCVWSHPLGKACAPGRLDPANAPAVLAMLDTALAACREGRADAMVTAPVQKSVINDAGIAFSGHTEYLAEACRCPRPVMLLVAGQLRVALATTHLPLSQVPAAITATVLAEVLDVLHADLVARFGLARPRILVCGLNPHAGEGGHLGEEDEAIIRPAVAAARTRGILATGPVPADTAFTPRSLGSADAVLAMYHDQGLPVLKASGFGEAVNVTLGLPVIRTSVDHGTALDLAGTGRADPGSLLAALGLAARLATPA